MDTVRLTVVSDEGAAEILCGVLRLEGIACSHRGVEGSVESFDEHCEVLVFEHDLERAREIVEAADTSIVEECARCGRSLGEDGSWYVDDAGELQPYCGVCAERLFG